MKSNVTVNLKTNLGQIARKNGIDTLRFHPVRLNCRSLLEPIISIYCIDTFEPAVNGKPYVVKFDILNQVNFNDLFEDIVIDIASTPELLKVEHQEGYTIEPDIDD